MRRAPANNVNFSSYYSLQESFVHYITITVLTLGQLKITPLIQNSYKLHVTCQADLTGYANSLVAQW